MRDVAAYRYKDRGADNAGEKPFFVVRHPDYVDTFIAFSMDENSFFHHRILLPFFKGLYPRCLLTFITHRRLRRLVETFEATNDFQRLTVTRATARIRYGHGSRPGSVPLVHWPGRPLAEAFDWVHDNNGWFQSLEFNAKSRAGGSVYVGLTRQGFVKTNRLLLKCYEGFILPVCKHIHENQDFFSRRSRRETPHLGIRPLAIDFDTDLFDEVDENSKFISAMREYRSAAVSVLHGNPYLHVSVIDYLDGSSFDVWAAEGSQLIIVPQLKASMPSVKRLVNHIFDNYGEGKIVNYEVAQ